MRVSTGMLYQGATQSITGGQSSLLRLQEQLSSGRRILAPSDDPIASAEALRVSQSRDQAAQFSSNAKTALDAISTAETMLAGAADTLQSARESLVAARNASYTDADRRAIAQDLRSRFGELLGAANARDGSGRYVFAGFSEESQPFIDDGTNVTYVGDAGQRMLALGPSRAVPVTQSGAGLFEGIPVGNGAFTTAVGVANTGGVAIGAGSVANAAALTGHNYSIVFATGASTTYSIVDTTTATTLSSGNPYVDGSAIAFDGLQVTVRGTPANGDQVTVGPPARQNVFAALREAIGLLETPVGGAASRGALDTGLERALANVDQGMERLLGARTAQGAGERESEAAIAAQDGLRLEYERQVSRLTDLDYAQAISDFTRHQQALEAAMKAFQGTTQLSLFSQM